MPSLPVSAPSNPRTLNATVTPWPWITGFGLVLIALRLWYVQHLRIDQDEWQHLHGIWAIGTGQMMYRDFFDNHMPLFHHLCAPLMQWMGERSDIITVMRLAVIPFFLGMLLLIGVITRTLYDDQRTGWWAALFAGLFPVFLFTGTEFRPDQMWTLLWLAALLVLIRGSITTARCFWAGVLLGLAFAVSMKTVLMITSLAGGAFMACVVTGYKPDAKSAMRRIGALTAGLVIAPSCVAAWFVAHGAFHSFWYCVAEHNLRFAHEGSSLKYLRALVFPLGLALVFWRSRAIHRSSPSPAAGMRRVLIFATGGIYFSLLLGFWTVLNNETYLPGFVVLMPALAAGLCGKSWRLAPPVVFAAAELLIVLIARPLSWRVSTSERELIGEVLALTRTNDFVMDESGENIFRRRPFYPVMETLTRQAIKRGEIPDTISQDIVKTGTCVVMRSTEYPLATEAFLDDNFLPFGGLLVAGHDIRRDPGAVSNAMRFEIKVPTRYAFLSRHGALEGTIDGTPYNGPRFLAAGTHAVVPNDDTKILLVVWDRAVEAGFAYDAKSSESPVPPVSNGALN